MTEQQAIRKALVRYMEWYSEDRWCAGWYIGLTEIVQKGDDDDCRVMQALARLAGGWWDWPKAADDVVFMPFAE